MAPSGKALVAAAAILAVCAPGAIAAPRAVLLLPAGDPPLSAYERAGLAPGAVSPSVGGYERDQVFLDLSQGARVSLRAYDDDLPQLRLEPGGSISGWAQAVRRARAVDGIEPGLLAATIERAGGRVAYLGVRGRDHSAAVVAADRSGHLGRAELVTPAQWASRVKSLSRDFALVVAQAPGPPRPLPAFVVAMRDPPRERELLFAGMSGGGGILTSTTTREPGLVASTDIAPTVLGALGIEAPEDMTGHEIEVGEGSAGEVNELVERLEVIAARRTPALLAALGAWLLLLGALALMRGAEGRRTALRVALLASMWLPLLVLVTAALEPEKLAESLAIGAGSVLLGLVTDRLAAWPRAPAIPAAAVLAAYTLDFAAGSPYSALSIAGPNPIGGARFFGAGNELEAILAVVLLIGTGAAAAALDAKRGARVLGFAALGGAFVLGPGRLGADVGAVITLGAGGAAAVIACLPGRPSARMVVVAVVVPVVGVALLALIDVVSAGGAHLTSTLGGADGPGDLWDVVERRARISVSGISGTLPLSLAVAAGLMAFGALRRRVLLAPVEPYPTLGAGITGAWVAVVVGTIANDSGPVFLLIGAFLLLVAVGYVRARPQPLERIPSARCV